MYRHRHHLNYLSFRSFIPRKLYRSLGWSRSSFHWWTLTPTLHRLYSFLHAIWPDVCCSVFCEQNGMPHRSTFATLILIYIYYMCLVLKADFATLFFKMMAVGWDESALVVVLKLYSIVLLPSTSLASLVF